MEWAGTISLVKSRPHPRWNNETKRHASSMTRAPISPNGNELNYKTIWIAGAGKAERVTFWRKAWIFKALAGKQVLGRRNRPRKRNAKNLSETGIWPGPKWNERQKDAEAEHSLTSSFFTDLEIASLPPRSLAYQSSGPIPATFPAGSSSVRLATRHAGPSNGDSGPHRPLGQGSIANHTARRIFWRPMGEGEGRSSLQAPRLRESGGIHAAQSDTRRALSPPPPPPPFNSSLPRRRAAVQSMETRSGGS